MRLLLHHGEQCPGVGSSASSNSPIPRYWTAFPDEPKGKGKGKGKDNYKLPEGRKLKLLNDIYDFGSSHGLEPTRTYTTAGSRFPMQTLWCCRRRRLQPVVERSVAVETEARLSDAVLELRLALRSFVDRRPAAEAELARAGIDLEEDRRTTVYDLQAQSRFIGEWHSWAMDRIQVGGGRVV